MSHEYGASPDGPISAPVSRKTSKFVAVELQAPSARSGVKRLQAHGSDQIQSTRASRQWQIEAALAFR